jgi:hypothetical protein
LRKILQENEGVKITSDQVYPDLIAVPMKSNVFRDVMPCSLVLVYRRFIETYCFHFQVLRYSMQAINKQQAVEDGGNTSSETSMFFCRMTWRHIPEDSTVQLYPHRFRIY